MIFLISPVVEMGEDQCLGYCIFDAVILPLPPPPPPPGLCPGPSWAI